MEKHEVVTDVISKAPKLVCIISYANGASANEGNVSAPSQVKEKPSVQWDAEWSIFYTNNVSDPIEISGKEPTNRTCLHRYVFF